VKMLAGGKSHDTAWRDLLASKGLSGAAPVLEEYGLSCENDVSLLVQEDLISLGSKLKQFHSRILRTGASVCHVCVCVCLLIIVLLR
jgi:hypothetical protein